MKKTKYISTTLPYANSAPHIGHALEFIQADALRKRLSSTDVVHLNVGLDEHGLKVYKKSQELGIDVKELLDKHCVEWKAFCESFEIGYDSFYRTSSAYHKELVQDFWKKRLAAGDLYKKSYTGKYCVGCESFKTEQDLTDGKCPDHNTVLEEVSEENYFFDITKYKPAILLWLSTSKFLYPSSKLQELENIILEGEDISVSRLKKNVPWGVPVPDDEEHVVYIWFDALLNYISAFACDGDFNEKDFIQFCGPDNLRFQGFLFQAILESDGLTHTKSLIVHGTVLDKDGKKMSKSVGNVVDPMDQLNKYGLDAVRYYALAGLTTFGNSAWNETDLVNKYNSDLADSYGNLMARVLHLIDTRTVQVKAPSKSIVELVVEQEKFAEEQWSSYDIHAAINSAGALMKVGNKLINDSKPWEKTCDDYVQVLSDAYFILESVTELLRPAISKRTYESARKALTEKKKVILFNKIKN